MKTIQKRRALLALSSFLFLAVLLAGNLSEQSACRQFPDDFVFAAAGAAEASAAEHQSAVSGEAEPQNSAPEENDGREPGGGADIRVRIVAAGMMVLIVGIGIFSRRKEGK